MDDNKRGPWTHRVYVRILLCAMPDNVWTQGSGWVGLGLGSGVCMDMASVSRSLCQLVFRVRDLVAGGGHVTGCDGEIGR